MIIAKLDQITANANKGKTKKDMSAAVASTEEIRQWVRLKFIINSDVGGTFVDP